MDRLRQRLKPANLLRSSDLYEPSEVVGEEEFDAAEGIHIAQRLRPSLQPGAFPELL